MASWDSKDYGWGSSIKTSDFSDVFKPKYDGAFSNAWKTGFDADNGGKNISTVFSNLFDKTRATDKWQNKYQNEEDPYGPRRRSNVSFGPGFSGQAGEILPGLLGSYTPYSHSPIVLESPRERGGLGGAIGTLAGIGASFIPGIGPGIAAALPAIGGNIGGMFG